MSYDLDTPEGRYAAIEAVGPEQYNELMEEHHRKSVIKTVAGHELRTIVSGRFGRLIAVGGTGHAFTTLEAAENYAQEHPREP